MRVALPGVRKLPPPVSDSPWSADFVMQSLEILPIFLRDGRIHWLRPEHAESLRVGWRTAAAPADLVTEALRPYGLRPDLVHSTSWRHEGDSVVLTYVAVVPPDQALAARSSPLRPVAVGHVDLARGSARGAPERIAIEQVVEHALRHLSWLSKDDPVVRDELGTWSSELASFEPEPFRSL